MIGIETFYFRLRAKIFHKKKHWFHKKNNILWKIKVIDDHQTIQS